MEISAQVANDDDFPIKKYDKVLFHPKNAVPVDFESDNLLYVVPLDDLVAVFRRTKTKSSTVTSADEIDDFEDE